MHNIKPNTATNIYQREWLVPYMGDSSFSVAATLRHFGINAHVLPTDTKRGYELAQKHIQSEVCYPLKGVTGDALDFLDRKVEEKGKRFVEDTYFVLLPTTCGPCRFGKYQETLRYFMDAEGLENVPLGGPSTSTDYSDILSEDCLMQDRTRLQKLLMKGLIAADHLDDITLRIRPYAKDKNQVNQLKKQRLTQLEQILENGGDTREIVRWGEETVEDYRQHMSEKPRFPLIIYAGEIYMRHHDPHTRNVVEQLETQGLEVVRTPVMEWIDYINKFNRIDSRSHAWTSIKRLDIRNAIRNIKRLITQTIKGEYIHYTSKRIAQPFHEILRGRHILPKPLEIVRTLERNNEFNRHIRGEAVLSIGIAYYLMHNLIPKSEHPISGMFHVGPFTCMQEGVATAKIESMATQLRKSNPDLLFPIIHGYFGDSPNPNLDSEIAVFREQCYQSRELQR